MEFSKEETNPLMFGYWGNKVFMNGFVTFVIPFILTLRKPNMIFSIFYILTCHSGNVYLDYEYLLVTMLNIYTKRLHYLRHE